MRPDKLYPWPPRSRIRQQDRSHGPSAVHRCAFAHRPRPATSTTPTGSRAAARSSTSPRPSPLRYRQLRGDAIGDRERGLAYRGHQFFRDSRLRFGSPAASVRRTLRPADLYPHVICVLAVLTWNVGTGAGLHFFFLVSATIAVLVMGIEHVVLACVLVAIGAGSSSPCSSPSPPTRACNRDGPFPSAL